MGDQATIEISIIIPAYNASKFLEETVRSVVGQLYTGWELIIVNDGSTDDTLNVSREIAEKDSRIVVIDQPNRGVSSARNAGILRAKGRKLAFLDADDLWKEDFLEDTHQLLDSNPDLGLVYADLEIIDAQGRPTGKIKTGKTGELLDDLLAWHEHVISPPSGVLVKRSILDSIGLFDESLSNNADQDFYIRVAAVSLIGRVAKPLLHYRIHDENMHSNINVMEKDSLQVFQKASVSRLFKDRSFERKCYANMYMILAMNFIGHENNWLKFGKYLFKSILTYPCILKSIYKKIIK